MPLYNHTSDPAQGSYKKYPSSSFESPKISKAISKASDVPDLCDSSLWINKRFSDIPNPVAWIFKQLFPTQVVILKFVANQGLNLNDLVTVIANLFQEDIS